MEEEEEKVERLAVSLARVSNSGPQAPDMPVMWMLAAASAVWKAERRAGVMSSSPLSGHGWLWLWELGGEVEAKVRRRLGMVARVRT